MLDYWGESTSLSTPNGAPKMSESRSFDAFREELLQFATEQGWDQQATAKDLVAALAIEAGELQELMLWVPQAEEASILETRNHEIASELADVVIYATRLADMANIDLISALWLKLDSNRMRFRSQAEGD